MWSRPSFRQGLASRDGYRFDPALLVIDFDRESAVKGRVIFLDFTAIIFQ
jgi:hypothetical protein